MSAIERLIADLRALRPDERVLCWSGWDREFPPNYTEFREYLFRAADLLTALTGQAPPPPATIRVQVHAAAGLRVRRTPVDGEVVGKLADDATVEVYEAKEHAGWYRIASGVFAAKYISAVYVAIV